ncbi:hypothetical protein YC2023_050306 [Brassica napus]|uniref:Uncharacterized protein n=1 Tax=Brassica oleracea TaxID=3712 RepID=A0A3P6BPR8_BRAOL|nr:unnamed protein product [Brassica oleracea]
MPLVFSLFFHKVVVCLLLQPSRLRKQKPKDPDSISMANQARPCAPEMSLIDENPLTPRSIFIHSDFPIMSNSQIHFSDLKAGPRLDQTPEVS